jgi:excinuclease ABC subunit A
VVAEGTPDEVATIGTSPTGRWLAGKTMMETPKRRRKGRAKISVKTANIHNLSSVNVALPTGCLVGVSGVSGSGKSSLVIDTFVGALRQSIAGAIPIGPWSTFKVGEAVDRLVVVDQAPIGRTPRSTPATYCKFFTLIRELFATTGNAQERGFKAGRFSFNAQQGRCVTCEGRGLLLFEMHFLPDVWTTCPECKGSRYNRETLEIQWRGRNIAEVLQMRADEALAFFANQHRISRSLQALVDVGLGYLQLGQPATTLSGGEAQRVKLAAELMSRKGHCVYILDEPTTGLHMEDVQCLVDVLHRLVEQGHSVWLVEHHLEVLWQCDYLVEMGPDGGEQGGQVVAKGRPELIAQTQTATGEAFRRR